MIITNPFVLFYPKYWMPVRVRNSQYTTLNSLLQKWSGSSKTGMFLVKNFPKLNKLKQKKEIFRCVLGMV